LFQFEFWSDFQFCSDLIFLNSRNGKCEKKTAKKQTTKKKKQKKTDTREMGQAHDQLGRERPAKKNTRGNSLMGQAQ
jgi:hypothetical protein